MGGAGQLGRVKGRVKVKPNFMEMANEIFKLEKLGGAVDAILIADELEKAFNLGVDAALKVCADVSNSFAYQALAEYAVGECTSRLLKLRKGKVSE